MKLKRVKETPHAQWILKDDGKDVQLGEIVEVDICTGSSMLGHGGFEVVAEEKLVAKSTKKVEKE